MPSVRPRPTSLTIPTASIALWRTIRSPTLRRSTHPSMSSLAIFDDEAPPVPALSYWDPDTPSPFASIRSRVSPGSPTNPYLAPPQPSVGQQYLSFQAAPLLPASPLSIFDSPMSPTASTFLHKPTPTPTKTTFLSPASPLLTPSFMFPRTPPPCPGKKRKVSVYDVVRDIAERKVSVPSMVRIHEMMRLKFYPSLLLKRQKETDDCSGEKKDRGEGSGWKMRGIWKRLVGGKDDGQVERESKIVLGGRRMKMFRLRGLVP